MKLSMLSAQSGERMVGGSVLFCRFFFFLGCLESVFDDFFASEEKTLLVVKFFPNQRENDLENLPQKERKNKTGEENEGAELYGTNHR